MFLLAQFAFVATDTIYGQVKVLCSLFDPQGHELDVLAIVGQQRHTC